MLDAKTRRPSRGSSDSGSEIYIHGLISPEVPEARTLSTGYSYSGYDKARCIQKDLNCTLLSVLVLLLLCSLATYGFILGIRYMVTTTEYYGEEKNCLISEVNFDGWRYKYNCLVCQAGWMLGEEGQCQLAHEGH